MADDDVRELKRTLERELRAAEEEETRRAADLERLARTSRGDGPELVAPGGLEVEDPALTVLRDVTLDPASRVDVIERLDVRLDGPAQYLDALLAILQDSDDAVPVRAAALRAVDTAAFQVVRFAPYRQRYDAALHDLAGDADPGLRESAIGVLALQHDPEIQRRLEAGLRGEEELPVPRVRAIQLLAEDDHLDNLPWLQELYEGGSTGARQEAARLMSSYPAARDTLESILRDQAEDAEVRQQSGASLRNLAPERFEDVAKEIAVDPGDDPAVRAAALHTLQHLGDHDRVYGDAEFLRRVEDLRADQSVPEVARVAGSLVDEGAARGGRRPTD